MSERPNTNYEFKVTVEAVGTDVRYKPWMRIVGSTYWHKIGDSYQYVTEHDAWAEIMDFVKETMEKNRANDIVKAHKEIVRSFADVQRLVEEDA